MERRAKVELFEQIRREYEFGIGTIKGVAHKLGVHRRMVRQALANAEPPERQQSERERPVIGPLRPFIDAILESDRSAPRKQRHTAHRIFDRIRTELPEHKVAEVTVRQYVRERKRQLGWSTRVTCVPQSYAPGQEGQVDWYEAWAELGGTPVKLQVFSLRSMASGAAFHRAYQRATQQAFLEAHEHAFHYFGGVFRLLRYDNLKSAVKKILRGHRREETTHFIAFRSHWRFESDFCTPAEPHEKGGIEGEAGYFRRNHWVPLPQARDLEELNAQLLAACHEDERRQIAGHRQTVGAAMIDERSQLLPLAEQGFELAELSFPRVDGLGCVRVRTNLYSAPAPPGRTVEVRLYPSHVEVRYEGRCVARHERCYERHQQVLDLEHYLDVLERKPGALIGSKPLAAWRARGLWPVSYDQLLAQLIDRHGKASGTRQMIQVLSLIRSHGHARVRAAVEEALTLGCADAAAVRHLVEAVDLTHVRDAIIELDALSRFERPLPVMTDYDGLLQEVAP
ncbi:MAG TPA: IS21 family transposase [Ktedonobacterales bacterium]|nr:IS21 family transposase [Ktedonobacterales bacterium]